MASRIRKAFHIEGSVPAVTPSSGSDDVTKASSFATIIAVLVMAGSLVGMVAVIV